jgi:hypothetical protein
MGWVCPECGLINKGDASACGCGFQSVFLISDPSDFAPEHEEESGNEVFGNALSMQNIFQEDDPDPPSPEKINTKKVAPKRKAHTSDGEISIKEIGAWKFSFLPSEGQISIGTPALHPFCLRMTIGEMQEILDAVYELTGAGKTLRSLEMGEKALFELVDFIAEMIDVKKSKIKLAFSPEELEAIKGLVNEKLSQ